MHNKDTGQETTASVSERAKSNKSLAVVSLFAATVLAASVAGCGDSQQTVQNNNSYPSGVSAGDFCDDDDDDGYCDDGSGDIDIDGGYSSHFIYIGGHKKYYKSGHYSSSSISHGSSTISKAPSKGTNVNGSSSSGTTSGTNGAKPPTSSSGSGNVISTAPKSSSGSSSSSSSSSASSSKSSSSSSSSSSGVSSGAKGGIGSSSGSSSS